MTKIGKRYSGERQLIDLEITAPRIVSRIGDWCVLDVTTLSNHQCMEFSIQVRRHPVNTERGVTVRSPSWNTRRLSKEKFREYLVEIRLIDGPC